MSPITRIHGPGEISQKLNEEFGVRTSLTGDPKSQDGATIFVWVRPDLDINKVRSRAASLCEEVYNQGFYVVPVVLPEDP